MQEIGIMHPGAMGVSVAASAIKSGYTVYWASERRSEETRERAEAHGLVDAESVAELCRLSPILISICPPHAAEAVAKEVAHHGFSGVHLDANAISPERAVRIGQIIEEAGGSFVDGGIIGGPAWQPGRTWLYLSGFEAQTVAACFESGPLETQVLGDEVGQASALKMCYAAYSKGTTALLTGILAAAQATGVGEALAEQWDRDAAGFSEQAERRARSVTAKAWRFEGEMREIADTFESLGLSHGFHRAAAEVYGRLTRFKDAPDVPELEEVITALLEPAPPNSLHAIHAGRNVTLKGWGRRPDSNACTMRQSASTRSAKPTSTPAGSSRTDSDWSGSSAVASPRTPTPGWRCKTNSSTKR